MEDAHIAKFNIAEDVHIFGVFDGHGGKEVASYVERHFIHELLLNENFKKGNYPKALTETFLRMDELMETPEGSKELVQLKFGTDEDNDLGYGMSQVYAGCTACVALIAKGVLYVANAGDSRCVLFSNGQALAMSEDHKPELDSERKRIQNAGGYIVDGRVNGNLNLARALGDFEYKKDKNLGVDEQLIIAVPEIRQRTLTSNDEMIVLGCDGIWESWTNQQLCEFLKEKKHSEKGLSGAIEELLDNLVAPDTSTGYGCDNMSCICVLLK